jgi:hypothetical protein
MRKIPEAGRPTLHCSENLKSRKKEKYKGKRKNERVLRTTAWESLEHTHSLTRDLVLSDKAPALNSALSGILILGYTTSMNIRPSTSTAMRKHKLVY